MMPTTYCSFQLEYGSIEKEFWVPEEIYLQFFDLRETFKRIMIGPEPSTAAELLAKFMGFVASFVNPKRPGPYNSILSYILRVFQETYLVNLDILGLTHSLMKENVNSEASKRIKENLMKNYYIALVNCNVRPERLESMRYHTPVRAIFGGQGNPLYLSPLIECYRLFGILIYEDFLFPISAKLNELVQSNPSFAFLYPQGLDILNWLHNPEQIPDQEYLLSAPVSCPLIALTQLAHYSLQCKIQGLTPGEYMRDFDAAAGRSQGIVTAIAISLSDSWDSFLQNAVKAVSLMFFIGARTGLAHPATTLPISIKQDSIENEEGCPSSMLVIRGFDKKQTEGFIDLANMLLTKEEEIVISHFNNHNNFGVCGPPESLYNLALILRENEPIRAMQNEANTISSDMRRGNTPLPFQSSHEFLPIYAPFNSYLLRDSYELIVEDTTNAGIEFSSKDIRIPVYDSHNGLNLQDYDKSPQECSLTSRVIKLVTELPVHWEEVNNLIGIEFMEFRPTDIFRFLA